MKKEEQVQEVSDVKFGFAATILGIFSILFFWALFVPSMIMGLTGIVFGIIQLFKPKKTWGIVGIVLSALGFLVALICVVKIALFLTTLSACISDPSASVCTEFASSLGMDTTTLQCLANPEAPECADLINSLQSQVSENGTTQ